MIQVKKEDTIIDIIEKIDQYQLNEGEIYFPTWHPVLYNDISLQVLVGKISKRNIILVTTDALAIKNLQKTGIKYRETSYKNLTQYNYNIYEYMLYLYKSYISKLSKNRFLKRNTLFFSQKKYKYLIHIFFFFFFSSLILFFTLYYFIFVKTDIIIYPELRVHKESLNFILQEPVSPSLLQESNTVDIQKISHSFSLTETYSASWVKKEESERWSGTLRILNFLPEKQNIITWTRLVSPEGIIFRTTKFITLPEWVTDNFWVWVPGVIDIQVTADTLDIQGKVVWENSNIPQGTLLRLPGLPPEYQESIYAQSVEDFQGWSDRMEYIVSQDDLRSAEKRFIKNLESRSFASLEKKITSLQKTETSQDIKLIVSDDGISYSDMQISFWEAWKVWTPSKSFTISWSITVSSYVYDSQKISQKLKSQLHNKILRGVEKIAYIDESSLSLKEIIYQKSSPYTIKANFEIDAVTIHDFLHKQNTYLQELLSNIKWRDIETAKKILTNDERISHTEIYRRPPFLQNIPMNERNINIIVSQKAF